VEEIRLYPSILSADFTNLRESIHQLQGSDIAGLHVDVMDGHFVPNLTFGPWICDVLKKICDYPLDVHLMIDNTYDFFSHFLKSNVEALTVHYESSPQLHRIIQLIKKENIKAGVSINPGTSVTVLEDVLSEIDMVLIMTVNPGFGGQSFLKYTLNKIEKLWNLKEQMNRDLMIYVDGGIDENTVKEVAVKGARGIIAGSSVFNAPIPRKQANLIIENAYDAIEKGDLA